MGVTVLISGASRGLGREAAHRLGARGWHVVVGARGIGDGERVAAEILDAGGRATAVALDVTDPGSVADAVARVRDLGDGLDALVNNAGRLVAAPAAETTAETMRAVFETNVFGVVELTTACLPLLRASPRGRVINVSSTTASLAMTAAGHDFGGDASTRMAYASSKAALNMVTVQLAATLRADPSSAHVTVHAVTPGFVATEINAYCGVRSVAEGARVVVQTVDADDPGPSGTFRNDVGPVAW